MCRPLFSKTSTAWQVARNGKKIRGKKISRSYFLTIHFLTNSENDRGKLHSSALILLPKFPTSDLAHASDELSRALTSPIEVDQFAGESRGE
jgi:hypothetical protein